MAYRITVMRYGKEWGILDYKEGEKTVVLATCYWDPEVRIPSKLYTGCSATVMDKKGYRSIYIPDEQTGRNGIFIHKGTKAEASDGCIVIDAPQIEKLWGLITPKDGQNVEVQVYDSYFSNAMRRAGQ